MKNEASGDIETMSSGIGSEAIYDMIRPPVNRFMKVLDRSCFQKEIRLCAAQILDPKDIHHTMAELRSETFRKPSLKKLVMLPGYHWESKALLLEPHIKSEDELTWTEKLRELHLAQRVKVTDYMLKLDYNDWNYHEILDAILPTNIDDEKPSGFAIAGHVAHLNLRDEFLPYKHLIADVLMDKNPTVRSVINKIEDVGEGNEFRTFKYELLAGDPDMNVEVRTQDCVFKFDFSKVYWNTRLDTEHRRLIDHFKSGEAVCDVMAGVGPFAVPSGKRHVFVWANDLNPDSYSSLEQAIQRNKVSKFVKAFNEDGRSFIREATNHLSEIEDIVVMSRNALKRPSRQQALTSSPANIIQFVRPKTFSHYIMNLPASASSFLPSFIGLYAGLEYLFTQSYPHPLLQPQMPKIHLYCFSTKSHNNAAEKVKICDEISHQLRTKILPEDEDVEIWPVRDVSPKKRMFCASFRLPAEVAFWRVNEGEVEGKRVIKKTTES